MRATTAAQLRDRLGDRRGGRVAIVSHCLLNENVRYLGGAARPGPVAEIVDVLSDEGIGIVQMPCPEQLAWGGVSKPRLLAVYGARRHWWFPFHGVLMGLGLAWTRHVYRRLARQVVRQIVDYRCADIDVVAVVGVGGSPSCGVLSTLDLRAAESQLVRLDVPRSTPEAFNREVIAANLTPGRGLFMAEVVAGMERSKVAAPLIEHDLLAELGGATSSAVAGLARACRSIRTR